uniref:VQ domain-containing protein n=1 Tax=Davidia involucrata TaxID=16924 RepID=A0A5B7BIM3_DAVIN
MDKLLSVQQRKATKQAKTKKKPVKVVYISNPMKVETSASEFRALVQELTGQDADMPDPTKYSEINGVGGDHHQIVPEKVKDDDHALAVPTVDPNFELPKKSDLSFEPYDDVFTPQMLESFSGLLPPSWLYESAAHVDVLSSFDAM